MQPGNQGYRNAQQQAQAHERQCHDQVQGCERKPRPRIFLRERPQASTDVARDKFKEAADTAKNVASGTADQIEDQARDKQRSGADFVERLAGNIREAARAFESDAPFAALGINSAAGYVDDAAEKIRNGSFRDLVDGATDFARRQPAAFLGISVLAGFAAVRFLKASGGRSSAPKRSENSRERSSSTQRSNMS